MTARVLPRAEVEALRSADSFEVEHVLDNEHVVHLADGSGFTILVDGERPRVEGAIVKLITAAPDLRATALDAIDQRDEALASRSAATVDRDIAERGCDELRVTLRDVETEIARLRTELAERAAAHEHTLGLLEQGTAIVKSLQADVQRWRAALLATAPECPQCYRLATWEHLGEEDTDDETVLDIACDTHRAFGGRWFERANVAELRELNALADSRAERLTRIGMEVIDKVLGAVTKGGAT